MTLKEQFPDDIVTNLATRMLAGKRIVGVFFGCELSIIIDQLDSEAFPKSIEGQTFLALSSPWELLSKFPSTSDATIQFSRKSISTQLETLASLAEIQINSVDIGISSRNLLIGFENGQAIILSGENNGFECWHLGLKNHDIAIHAIYNDIIICGTLDQ